MDPQVQPAAVPARLQHAAAVLNLLPCLPCLPCLDIALLQLVPRVNPAFPLTESYVSADRQRLLLRLEMYALQERVVKGDGNCQVSSTNRTSSSSTSTSSTSNGLAVYLRIRGNPGQPSQLLQLLTALAEHNSCVQQQHNIPCHVEQQI
jgi:hypothetical protein